MNVARMHRNEKGIALVMSMLILLVMSLLGLVLMAGASLNRGLAGNDQRMRESLNLAEAGIGEALARIRNQETLMSPLDVDDVCQVYNTVAGSVPVLGADSTALATGQPVGQFLDYTTPTRGPDVLTIYWKKNTAGTQVMRYDPTKNPKIGAYATGSPIFTVESTGRVNNARRTVVAEVIQKPYMVNAKGALVADVGVGALGNAVICGYDHFIDTNYDDGHDGRPVAVAPDPDHCQDNEKGAGTDMPGIWSSSTVDPGGAYKGYGNPDTLSGQTNFYAGPWDVFNMSQAEYWSFMGLAIPFAGKTDWNGVFYVDNNSVTQDASEDMSLHSVSGEGFLYVDGDLSVNAGFHYKGLIYVEGNLKINGVAWVLGSIVVKGDTEIKVNGGMTLLYSKDAIEQMLAKYGGQFVTLSWREK